MFKPTLFIFIGDKAEELNQYLVETYSHDEVFLKGTVRLCFTEQGAVNLNESPTKYKLDVESDIKANAGLINRQYELFHYLLESLALKNLMSNDTISLFHEKLIEFSESPQVIVFGPIYDYFSSAIMIPLLKIINARSLKKQYGDYAVHFAGLLYSVEKEPLSFHKGRNYAFMKELEWHLDQDELLADHYWLFDNKNDKAISFDEYYQLIPFLGAFLHMIALDYHIIRNVFEHFDNNIRVNGKRPVYKTMGMANLALWKKEIYDYLSAYGLLNDLEKQVDSIAGKVDVNELISELNDFYKDIALNQLSKIYDKDTEQRNLFQGFDAGQLKKNTDDPSLSEADELIRKMDEYEKHFFEEALVEDERAWSVLDSEQTALIIKKMSEKAGVLLDEKGPAFVAGFLSLFLTISSAHINGMPAGNIKSLDNSIVELMGEQLNDELRALFAHKQKFFMDSID